MKVAELKKGMLLRPGRYSKFCIKFNNTVLGAQPKYNKGGSDIKTAVYIGTRKEAGGNIEWSNRYVLFHNRVLAVDPSDWFKIEPQQIRSK